MPSIQCSVNNCSHNNSNVCYANVVNVGGNNATSDESTCCASFLDSANYGSLCNNVNEQGSPCNAITCSVDNCTYNANHLCNASSIDVSGQGVNLYTETNCSTFTAR